MKTIDFNERLRIALKYLKVEELEIYCMTYEKDELPALIAEEFLNNCEDASNITDEQIDDNYSKVLQEVYCPDSEITETLLKLYADDDEVFDKIKSYEDFDYDCNMMLEEYSCYNGCLQFSIDSCCSFYRFLIDVDSVGKKVRAFKIKSILND